MMQGLVRYPSKQPQTALSHTPLQLGRDGFLHTVHDFTSWAEELIIRRRGMVNNLREPSLRYFLWGVLVLCLGQGALLARRSRIIEGHSGAFALYVLNHEARQRGRDMLSSLPGGAALLEAERPQVEGEPLEPEGWA